MTQNSVNNESNPFTIGNMLFENAEITAQDTDGDVGVGAVSGSEVIVTASEVLPTGDRTQDLGNSTNSWEIGYFDGITFDDGTNVLNTFVDTTSWSPVLEYASGTSGVTYSDRGGIYVRFNEFVFVNGFVQLSSKGSGSNTVQIIPFPLAPSTTNGRFLTFAGTVIHVEATSGATIYPRLRANSNGQMYFQRSETPMGVNIGYGDIYDDSEFYFTGLYPT